MNQFGYGKMSVDYNILSKFIDEDKITLDYHKVCNSLERIDDDEALDIIFKYYRKNGFPHYTIREEEKHEQMRKLQNY